MSQSETERISDRLKRVDRSDSNMVPPPTVNAGKRKLSLNDKQISVSKKVKSTNQNQPATQQQPSTDLQLLTIINELREDMKKRDDIAKKTEEAVTKKREEEFKRRDEELKVRDDEMREETRKLRANHVDLSTLISKEVNYRNDLLSDYNKMLQKVALVTQNQNLSSIAISPRVPQQSQQKSAQTNTNVNANLKSSTINDGATTSSNIPFIDDEDWFNDDEEAIENGKVANFQRQTTHLPTKPPHRPNLSTPKPSSSVATFSSYINKKLPEFFGKPKEDFEAWVTASKKFLKQFPHMSNIKKANNIAMGVVGDAALILETIDQPIEFPEQIFNWLKETYGTKRTVEELMGSVKQLKEESVRSYFGRVKARLLTIYENGKSVAYESAVVLYFRAGLLQPIQKALYALHPSGVVATLQSATQIESDFNQARLLKNNASDPMYLMEPD